MSAVQQCGSGAPRSPLAFSPLRAALRQRSRGPPALRQRTEPGPPRGPALRLPRPGSDSPPPSGTDGSARAIFPLTAPPPRSRIILTAPPPSALTAAVRCAAQRCGTPRPAPCYPPANRPAALTPLATVLPTALGPSPPPLPRPAPPNSPQRTHVCGPERSISLTYPAVPIRGSAE